MELINAYICLTVKKNSGISHSFCAATQNDTHICLVFGLFANDCLFDLAENNYEVIITIDKAYLEKYTEPFEMTIEQQAICCNTQTKLLEIVDCKLQGIHRKIFIESAILFLLYQSQKNNLFFQIHCNSCAVLNKPVEIEKIQKARKFILDHLSANLTIPIIAINSGTNQCYLKKGFKEIFNQTIFEFIQENRMVLARHLLQKPHPNITQIAHTVGYSSLSSFSQSYKSFFGISPTEQIKLKFSNN